MDIAMCCYDMETEELEYSGANNSLIVIRKNIEEQLSTFLSEESQYRFSGTDLLEIKADKQSIGSYSKGITFKSHKLKIQKGDRIYLFSDGFPDQFGGERAKKLKMAEFKHLLSKERLSEFRNQWDILQQFRKQWQGNLQQVDDICILGIQF